MRVSRVRYLLVVAAMAASAATFAAGAAASVPQTVTHQGRLYDASDKPISGPLMVTFAIYADAQSATPLWTETDTITFDEGYFSVTLGSTTPFGALFDGSVLYLGVTVGADPEMVPRSPVQSVPYAMVAGDAIGDIHPSSVSIGGATVIDGNGDWVGNMAGLQGPQGPQGPQGLQGPQGPAGSAGVTGAVGATGPQGSQGLQGLQGLQGVQGAAGPAGAAGAAGAQGPQGNVGPQGPQGPQGAAGAAGAAGAMGSTGPAGPAGAAGALGPTGPAGPAGAAGVLGPTGPAGSAGAAGAAGPMGAAGAAGAAGPTGPAGVAGALGPTGPDGAAGATGPQGAQGPAGPAGPMGGSGTAGFFPVFTAATTLGSSVIQQAQPSGWSNVAVGFNGTPGSGANSAPIGVDIQGTVSEGSPNGYGATQLIVEGDLSSSAFAQAYLRGVIIGPAFNFGAGYGNVAEGAYIAAPNITAGYSNSVSSLELAQPAAGAAGTSCSAALNIGMPNQAGNCPAGGNRVWSIYNGSADSSFFAGNVGFGQALPAYPIQTGGGAYVTAGGVWTNASSRALKKDIEPLPAGEAMKTLAALDPVTFKYKTDDEAHVGFIAEDVPDLVAAKDRKGLSAMDIVAVLTKVVQEHQRELARQQKELDALKARLAR